MRVALVQSEEQGSVRGLARALRRLGHDVTLVVPQVASRPSVPAFVLKWQGEGFPWIPITSARLVPESEQFPRHPGLITARALAGILVSFDIAWFFESHWAAPALRERRFRDRMLPMIVLDSKLDRPLLPASLEEINRIGARQYARRLADKIVHSQPNEPDEAIHEIENIWNRRRKAVMAPLRPALTSPAVTVCIPYFEAHEFLLQTLESLERQTSDAFTVVVVDDGSWSTEGQAAFAMCAARFAERGWRFIRQTNRSPGAARNRAAQEAATEFLLFLDADDIAMPDMVDCFLRGALRTGDDCLVAANYGFRDDPEGPCELLYDPPGTCLAGSMADDMHGGSCILVRREAFWSIGGFSEVRGVGFEDYEFHIRCNLERLRWDVLPDLVYRYRMPRASNVSRSTSIYPNQARVLRWYGAALRPIGLEQMPLAVASAYWRDERVRERVSSLERTLASRLPKRTPVGRELKMLLLTCNFPFGIVSGWHTRVQQMIRYFGSRYEVTLVTVMPREQLAPVRQEAFEYLHAVRGVEGSNTSSAIGDELPFRIRQQTTDTLQSALRSLPTEQYHVAIIDQIFLAECRKEIDTLSILTEHNIESRLLRQAGELTWRQSLPKDFLDASKEATLMSRYEDLVWPEFPLRAAVSELDRAEMDRRAKRGKTVLAANGADPASWLPHLCFEAATALFPAHLAYPPNVEAVEFLLTEVWPKVVAVRPAAKLIVAGRDPGEPMKAMVAKAERVELCASPATMASVARRASVSVAPLRLGSGTRCKILESMAWGLPVVSTTLGAEGIEAMDNQHLLIRDDAQEFAEAIVQLLTDRVLWQRLRDQARVLVRERYSWDRVFEPFEDALIELVS